jgi:2-methylcitrate dehydratase PrpD
MEGHRVQAMLYTPLAQKQSPATAIDAKFSLPFTVASALCHGEITLHSYRSEALQERAVLDLAKRLTFTVSTDPSATDNATRGQLTLVTQSGTSLSMYVENPLGHSSRPMSETALIDKFMQCASLARMPLAETQRRQLAALILALPNVKTLGDDFFALLSARSRLSPTE